MESDLRTISSCNKLCKYAVDTNLLVPQNSMIEYEHVKKWAVDNKMVISHEKNKRSHFPKVYLFKHQRQRAEATYMPVKSVQ